MIKMCKKMAVLAGLMMLVTSIVIPLVAADGWHPSDEYLHLYEPYQKAVIYWDGWTETLILSSAVKSDNLTDIAWVVPILSTTMPNVTAGNMSIFEDLVDYFKTHYYWHYDRWYLDVTHYGNNSGITVLEAKEVDIYDVIILKATNASDLIDWLIDNDFKVPEEATSVIERYVTTGDCYFVVNKIDLKNRYKEVIELIESGKITVDLTQYVYPLHSSGLFERFKQVHAIQIICNQNFYGIWTWIKDYQPNFLRDLYFTEEEYAALVNEFATDNQEFIDAMNALQRIPEDFESIITNSTIKDTFEALYELLSEKLDPIYEYYQMRQNLKDGMATPLQFKFTPLQPYYPLTISSLNAGYGVIEVYVIAEHPSTDENKVLTVEECKEVDRDLREKLAQHFSVTKADFVTRLSYHGQLDELNDDAEFIFYPLSKPEHPIFMDITSTLENLTAKVQLTGIAWDPDEDVIEVQYRFDDETTWKVADGTTHWSLMVDTETLTDGNHTLQVRVLRNDGMSPFYSEIYVFTFSTQNTKVSSRVTAQALSINPTATLVAGLVVVSLVAVAVISRKIILRQ
jgi:hypothetical protein